MILIVGGIGSGKRAFVTETLGWKEEDMASALLDDRPVLCDLQELLRTEKGEALLPRLLEKEAVLCNEVGCGVIPLGEAERSWREAVGRLCCHLATEATAVVRLHCGLPVFLKGSL